jgi:hypothetical protein
MTLHEQADHVGKREDLQDLIRELRQNLIMCPDEWQNNKLPDFLEAIEAWLKDSPGLKSNLGVDLDIMPNWQLVAQVLVAGRSYE